MKNGTRKGLDNEMRKAIYRRDGFECVCCGSTRSIQVHHIVHRGVRHIDEPWNLVTLCELCHMTLHGQRPHWAGHPLDLDADAVEARMMEYICDHYVERGAFWTPRGLVDVDAPSDEDVMGFVRGQMYCRWDHDLLEKYLDGGGQ